MDMSELDIEQMKREISVGIREAGIAALGMEIFNRVTECNRINWTKVNSYPGGRKEKMAKYFNMKEEAKTIYRYVMDILGREFREEVFQSYFEWEATWKRNTQTYISLFCLWEGEWV